MVENCVRACVGGSCLDNDRPLPPSLPSSRPNPLLGRRIAAEIIRRRKTATIIRLGSARRLRIFIILLTGRRRQEKVAARGRDEYEMRSESSRRGSGGEIREKGIKIFHLFLSSPLSSFFSSGLIAIRSLRVRRLVSREKGCLFVRSGATMEWN